MIKNYQQSIAISQQCCAIANIGNTWAECWEALLAGRRIFSQGSAIIPGWPDSPPLSAILNFPGLDEQPPFSQRTDILARIVGQQMRATIDQFLTTHPSATLSLLVATSHGNPGPLSEIANVHCAGGEMSMIDSSTWKGIVEDNLIKEINTSLGRELPGVTISAACASSLVAISYASDRINANLCDAVLVVAIDTLSRVASVGFNNIGAMSQQGCRPYDKQRDGTTVGEGAVAMFLSRENLLPEQDVYGLIAGTSIFCDATHMVEPNSSGIAIVIQSALQQAQLQPSDIHGIFWHGTGTRQNDKTEASAAQIVFGNRSPLCTSTKGSLGHTMGASGAFNVLAACEAIRQKILPHIVGTHDPEYDNLHLTLNTPHPITSGPILVTALGFGGINAAMTILPPKGFQ
ncbi:MULTISPECIES: beta-ketoacyl synthase N-terminal-like domain-containing protein [unclassified Herbaspirillum]|uniref:beta-ketoacyl synthase N-terminal-like domain-containing protein n=1 Tax=unclassified Herbaspirillum TaxID=2624150 RepID=UPI0011545E48|nr:MULTISPECIES: beta-ketoacyl synthase N-terminal-like domain-containing protein [unclassified Herbaspirillum]MBB5393825.1 3-oxoacyl-[acyl-carrier-protein] synthase II [Herbaspirillum sp. SJZ102]TQK01318.1 3-oxoacyl-[acyl-carrier-protein] synthase II [Herbaspirillum sp. SJZ130]TQK05714.1 3-oxoacyl-[acyl-carrier-protein] synthase II [Herbaspirillum sp. SJZ106]